MSSWVEKYRPESLDDMIGQEGVIDIMNGFLNEVKEEGKNELPHFLFSGPTGVGKTATAEAFARDLWGDEWRQHWVEKNASDDRGIDVIRNEIKKVARQKSTSGGFRIVFLDEVDNVTKPAQKALRRTMEKYSDSTKFILSCNYPAQLIDAITGRCNHRRFTPVDTEKLTQHLKMIADEEDIDYEMEALEFIAEAKEGKVRNAIQELQALGTTKELTLEWAKSEISDVTREEIRDIFQLIKSSVDDDTKKREIDEEVIKLYQSGVTPREILIGLYDYILEQEPSMVKTLSKIGEIDANISRGSDPLLQLRCFLFFLVGKVSQ